MWASSRVWGGVAEYGGASSRVWAEQAAGYGWGKQQGMGGASSRIRVDKQQGMGEWQGQVAHVIKITVKSALTPLLQIIKFLPLTPCTKVTLHQTKKYQLLESSKMSRPYNITDPDLFAAINSTINLGQFLLLTLPAIILNVVCIVALLLAKTIKRKVRAAIINILAAEMFNLLGSTILYAGYPIRVTNNDVLAASCPTGIAISIFGLNSDLLGIAIYAIAVYIFIKYDIRKLKWSVLITFITISWAVCFIFSVALFFLIGRNLQKVDNGFCVFDDQEINTAIIISQLSGALLVLATVVVVVIFDILIFYYVRRNVADENVQAKKAVVKILAYHSVKMFGILSQFIVGAVLFPLLSRVDSFIVAIAVEYILNILYSATSLLTPIMSLVLLQPLRDALKEKCPCCMQRAVTSPPQIEAGIEMTERQNTSRNTIVKEIANSLSHLP